MQKNSAPREAWINRTGSGPQIVFGHANGFPPETYRLLLDDLGHSYSVATFAARPLWPGSDPESVRSWRNLAGDLGREIDRRGVVGALGVGHSLGSVLSLQAAADDPKRFSALVLIDPVIFSGIHSLFWGAFKRFGFSHRLPLIRSALRRRDSYTDLDEVRRSWSGKAVFKSWKNEVLEDYIRAAFIRNGEGDLRLRYPKAWEARIFEMTPASVWRDLAGIDLPMLFIRGDSSDTFLTGAAARIRSALPSAEVVEVPESSHFVPMERPHEVASLIIDWASQR